MLVVPVAEGATRSCCAGRHLPEDVLPKRHCLLLLLSWRACGPVSARACAARPERRTDAAGAVRPAGAAPWTTQEQKKRPKEITRIQSQEHHQTTQIKNPRRAQEGRASILVELQYKVSRFHPQILTLDQERKKGKKKNVRGGGAQGERKNWEPRGRGEGGFNPNNSHPKRLLYP